MSDRKDCWTCDYQDNWGPSTFLGRCKYFATRGKKVKDILPEVVDVGCKFWEPRIPKVDSIERE